MTFNELLLSLVILAAAVCETLVVSIVLYNYIYFVVSLTNVF